MALAEGKIGLAENRISRKFQALREKNKKGLITFITAGDPDLDTTVELVLEMEKAGADIIELGVPYSDPLADGPIIQKASIRALKNGTNLSGIFEAVIKIRRQSNVPLLLMTYYNPILKYGLKSFAVEAGCAGVDGVIVPDLPMEEAAPLEQTLQAQGMFLIPLIAPTSSFERMKKISKGDKGFVYCVSLTGVTGVRNDVPVGLEDFMTMARKVTDNPLAVGFGVSTAEQAGKIAKHCDAVIVGSALVKTIEDNLNSADLVNKVITLVNTLRKSV